MAEISTTRGAGVALDTMPACPECNSSMIVRAHWSGGHVTGLNWVCRRAPGCEGVRRIRNPQDIRPLNHDASTQAIFDWESSRDMRAARRAQPNVAGSSLSGRFGKFFNRSSDRPSDFADFADFAEDSPAVSGSMGYFDSLVEVGYVVLENRGLSSARASMDNVLIGPSGVFVVARKAWAGTSRSCWYASIS